MSSMLSLCHLFVVSMSPLCSHYCLYVVSMSSLSHLYIVSMSPLCSHYCLYVVSMSSLSHLYVISLLSLCSHYCLYVIAPISISQSQTAKLRLPPVSFELTTFKLCNWRAAYCAMKALSEDEDCCITSNTCSG